MKALLNPDPTISSIPATDTLRLKSLNIQRHVKFPATNGDRWNRRLYAKAAIESATIDQQGLSNSDVENPSISSSYRSPKHPKPNPTVLEAQARVCTGPTQTRPLTEQQTITVLDTILRSGNLFLCQFIIP